MSDYRALESRCLNIEGDVTLTKSRKLLFIWGALIASTCSFGIGLILFRGWSHQVTPPPLAETRQSPTPNSKSISPAGSLNQAKTLTSPTAKQLIVTVPKQFQEQLSVK